ncbi:MAG: Veg family protein [Clostridia bacterium]
MRNIIKNMDDIKSKVGLLIGREISFRINRGRNKIENFDGKIENAYSSIFTIRESESEQLQSFSYSDILSHNIKFQVKK